METHTGGRTRKAFLKRLQDLDVDKHIAANVERRERRLDWEEGADVELCEMEQDLIDRDDPR